MGDCVFWKNLGEIDLNISFKQGFTRTGPDD